MCSTILFSVLVSVNLHSSFISHRGLQFFDLPLNPFQKLMSLAPSSPLVTKQKIRIDASNTNQESKSQSKLLQVSGITVLYADGLCLNGTHHKRLFINYNSSH